MKVFIFLLSSVFSSFISSDEWIKRRIGSVSKNGPSESPVRTEKIDDVIAKFQEMRVKSEICNAKTCSKCVELIRSFFLPKSKIYGFCANLLSLSKCCPQKLLVRGYF